MNTLAGRSLFGLLASGLVANVACSGGTAQPASDAGAANHGGSSAPGGAGPSGAAGSSSIGGAGASAGAGASGAGASGAGAGGGAGASGGTTGTDPFVLAWQDDFDTLNPSSWQAQNFTFAGNQAQFTPANASVSGGILTLALTAAASGAAKPYLGVELRSARTLTYGKVSARMRFATGSGVVSGLVLFYTPYPNCDWNEIDIEHLGKASNTSQLNAMVFPGTQVPNCTTSVSPTQEPLIANLGFNAETDYHLYDIEWTPTGVKYVADGVLLRTWTTNIALLRRPLTVLLTIWASSAADWAGPIDATSAPTSAAVDWIKVYTWNG